MQTRANEATKIGEREMASRILAIEAEIEATLSTDGAPTRRRRRSERTRAAAVDGLCAGVRALDADQSPRADRLRALWAESERLRWQLALSAIRVAYAEARRLRGWQGMTESDLVQEGMIGLVAAAKRFDPERGIRFPTYARWWVRAHMMQANRQARLVRLAASANEQLRKLRRAIADRERVGAWTVAEVAADVGIGEDRARYLLEVAAADPLDGEGAELSLPDDDGPSPEERAIDRQTFERLRQVMRDVLSERQHRILTLRYGIGEDEPRTIGQIASRLSLSGERVRQIERECLACLREAAWAENPEIAAA